MEQGPIIAESAHKHGIADADILHAVNYAMRWVQQNESTLLIIGPSRRADLLELVELYVDGEGVIIHADILRKKFYKYLEEG